MTTYSLEIHELDEPFSGVTDIDHATRVDIIDSDTPFGSFRCGETLHWMPDFRFMGEIQHIHHWVGKAGSSDVIHKTCLYLYLATRKSS
jgi:hypothetical protein